MEQDASQRGQARAVETRGQNSEARTRVVVIGAGFGGLQVARALARDEHVQLAVVDRENHHLFQPLLYQVATAGLSPSEIAVPIRAVLGDAAHTEVFLAEALSADPARKEVTLRDGRVLSYDYLVVAAGAHTNYFGNEDWSQHAYGMKDLRDALRLKERILLIFEQAEHEPDPARKRRLLTFVVVGGGPTGVELAGAISELGRMILTQDFRHIGDHDIRVILVEMADRVLAPFDPKLSEQARRSLSELEVETRFHAKVSGIGPGWVQVGSERIECGLVCWAPGVEAVPLIQRLGLPVQHGKIVVDANCAVPGHPEVFVLGDMASFTPPSPPGARPNAPLPALAAVAMQQGKHVGALIRGELRGRPRRPFRYRDRGIMATIGRNRAVAQTRHLRLHGFLAWIAWIFIHVFLLIGFRNRVLVLYEWFWAYLLMKRGSRIMTRRDDAPAAEITPRLPAEPGDERAPATEREGARPNGHARR
jgi:NADH dehydrogenase